MSFPKWLPANWFKIAIIVLFMFFIFFAFRFLHTYSYKAYLDCVWKAPYTAVTQCDKIL